MVVLRGVKSSRQAGVTHRAPGRKPAARSRARLAAVISMACAAGVFGATNASAAPARPQVTAARNATTAVSMPSNLAWWPSTKPTSAPAPRTRASTLEEFATSTAIITLGHSLTRALSQPGRCLQYPGHH